MTTNDIFTRFNNLQITDKDHGVWLVTLNRPEKRNALDEATIDELIDLFSSASRAGARAIVLAGAGAHL